MDVVSLNQRFIRELLILYRELPAVWKLKSPEYKNKMAKARAYELLVQKCREYVPNADREFVKTKINSLRTSFRKELRKVQTSQTTAKDPTEIYVPNLWYYNLLTFTTENEESSGNYYPKNDSNINESSYLEESDDNTEDVNILEFKNEPISTQIEIENDPLSLIEENGHQSPPPNKKPKLDTSSSTKTFNATDDVFDAIGKNVAHKLRGMSEHQRIIAEKIISDVMYHGQMETLTTHAHLSLAHSRNRQTLKSFDISGTHDD